MKVKVKAFERMNDVTLILGHAFVFYGPFQKSSKKLGWLTFCEFFNFGGGMSRILLMACSGGSLKNGGSPSTISIIIIPEKINFESEFKVNKSTLNIHNDENSQICS